MKPDNRLPRLKDTFRILSIDLEIWKVNHEISFIAEIRFGNLNIDLGADSLYEDDTERNAPYA